MTQFDFNNADGEKQSVIEAVAGVLMQQDEVPVDVINVIEQYRIKPDDLTEAGVDFETVCAVDMALLNQSA